MNLPNKLTLTRILLVPVFMVFVSLTSLNGIADGSFQPTYYLIAGIVFAAASFTDFLDGHLARKWNMVTDFGKFADPLADKLLTTVAFILHDAGRRMQPGGAVHHSGPRVRGVRSAHGGSRCQGRQGDRRQHVGQGEDRAADAEHHLLLLWHVHCKHVGYRHRAGVRQILVISISMVLCWLVAAVTAISGIKYLWDNRSFINTAK